MSDNKNRNFGLDLVRAIAVVIVLLHHWLSVYAAHFLFFSVFGFYGVEFFFVLSGFLIGNILIKSYLNEVNFNHKIIFNFWTRRWMRTLPLYYSILAVEIVLFIISKVPIRNLWEYFFFVQNIFRYDPTNHDFYGVAWSLSIEEWFYLSFPVILALISWLFRKFTTKHNILLIVISLFIILSFIIRVVYSLDGSVIWNNQLRKAVICREDSIGFGVLAAFLNNYYKAFLHNKRNIMFSIGILFLIIGVVVFVKDISYSYAYSTTNVSFFSKTLLFTMISLGVMLTLPFFFYLKINNGFIKYITTYISRISYSLYLVHLFMLTIVVKIFAPGKNILHIVLSLGCFLILSVLTASITYTLIEKTFLTIRDKFSSEKYKPV